MATVKTTTLVQSCKTCGKTIMKGSTVGSKIGSPLITCKHCKTRQYTPMRSEWYNYEAKILVWIWPVMLPIIGLIAGWLMGKLLIGLIVAAVMLIVGLCISSVNIVKALLSKKRMKKAVYLQELLQFDAITNEDYYRFLEKAK